MPDTRENIDIAGLLLAAGNRLNNEARFVAPGPTRDEKRRLAALMIAASNHIGVLQAALVGSDCDDGNA